MNALSLILFAVELQTNKALAKKMISHQNSYTGFHDSLSCSSCGDTEFNPCLNTSLTFELPEPDSSFQAQGGSDCLSHHTSSRAGAERRLLLQAYHRILRHHL